MNYYINGDAAKADQIKAAFEVNGIDTSANSNYGISNLFYFSCNGEVAVTQNRSIINIIKTHPDYKELELPIESKFKVGDWVVKKNGETFYGGNYAEQITLIEVAEKERMWLSSTTWIHDDDIRLWTIADAKDGDVLATGNIICIFKKLDKDGYYIISPCIYTVKDGLEVIDDEDDTIGSCGFKPATKEDRELLFRKIKEAGYKWDADKKELNKIQTHYGIANFHEGMPVLVRDGDCHEWRYVTFSHYRKVGTPFCAGGQYWYQCIPLNDDTKHLLGTTEMCPEEYINW